MKFRRFLCFMLVGALLLSCVGCQVQGSNHTTANAPSPSEAPSLSPTEEQTKVPAEESAELPPEASTEEPTEGLTEEPTETPTEESTEIPTEVPTEESSEESTEISTEAPTEESTEAPSGYTFQPVDETVYTTADLNVRRGPDNRAEIVTVATKGTPLKRIGYHADWSQIDYNGEILYAGSAFLSTSAPSTSTAPDDSSDYTKSRPFGYVRNERDALNVPLAMYSYQNRWGQYADFIQDTSQKVIYLTMDEGYEYGFTPAILDILKEKNVKVVFFLTGQFVNECPTLVQRMIDEGHIIGNHSTSHPADGMPSLSSDEQTADVMNLHNKVLAQFGYEMKLFRFPSGTYSTSSLELMDSLGYRSVFWSFAYRDFYVNAQPDPTEAMNMCLGELHPGAIYLLHAVSATNTAILGDWIDAVRAQGYEFGIYPVN